MVIMCLSLLCHLTTISAVIVHQINIQYGFYLLISVMPPDYNVSCHCTPDYHTVWFLFVYLCHATRLQCQLSLYTRLAYSMVLSMLFHLTTMSAVIVHQINIQYGFHVFISSMPPDYNVSCHCTPDYHTVWFLCVYLCHAP